MTRIEALHPDLNGDTGPSLKKNLWRWLLLMGTPVLLGSLFFIHPDGSGGLDTLLPVSRTWLVLHVVMLPLLGLLGVSFYVLLSGYTGPVAMIGRLGVAIYLTFYIAFEAIAGVATGVLTHEAHMLSSEQQEGVTAAIDALGIPSVMLGFLGTIGAVIAVSSIGILLRQSGAPLVPVLFLGGAPLATLFHSGTPVDAIAMTVFLVGIVWLELRWRRDKDGEIV
ncbi:hypothetical protein SAMN05444422_11540 [Halobiforma haloterrestris]|uniref:Uncharacterized protein n=1 Tax=Natronobacterium haloterrestre TaxID=148448 RepID=A0A1I1L9W4_NATHA|nr:hypothetical protein [Halobiforma haloterrestris]SFC69755.1 hypothetical protein SAMN05444422_11540 [Halobiforma haloterrestris]